MRRGWRSGYARITQQITLQSELIVPGQALLGALSGASWKPFGCLWGALLTFWDPLGASGGLLVGLLAASGGL